MRRTLTSAVGVHPNTVRLYEAWGFLPPIPRSRSGYRLFSETHLTLRSAQPHTWAVAPLAGDEGIAPQAGAVMNTARFSREYSQAPCLGGQRSSFFEAKKLQLLTSPSLVDEEGEKPGAASPEDEGNSRQ